MHDDDRFEWKLSKSRCARDKIRVPLADEKRRRSRVDLSTYVTRRYSEPAALRRTRLFSLSLSPFPRLISVNRCSGPRRSVASALLSIEPRFASVSVSGSVSSPRHREQQPPARIRLSRIHRGCGRAAKYLRSSQANANGRDRGRGRDISTRDVCDFRRATDDLRIGRELDGADSRRSLTERNATRAKRASRVAFHATLPAFSSMRRNLSISGSNEKVRRTRKMVQQRRRRRRRRRRQSR